MTRVKLKRLSRVLSARHRPNPHLDEKPSAIRDPLLRIDALTNNARNTWFALLGVLVFVGVTLLGVEHIDFWGVNRATKLPLVDVSVPTRFFFGAAPILIAAVYCYFHLYLIRLWDALGAAPARINGEPLGDLISPWLVSDAALHVRLWYRRNEPPCVTRRILELPATMLNITLAWLFGVIVLYYIWQLSFPARDLQNSALAAVSLVVAGVAGLNSLAVLIERMAAEKRSSLLIYNGTSLLVVVISLFWVGVTTVEKTQGSLDELGSVNLVGAQIVERPDRWIARQFAERDFRWIWCKRETIKDCADLGDRQVEFDQEWTARRSGDLASLRKPPINSVSGIEVDEAIVSALSTARDEAFNANAQMTDEEEYRIIQEALSPLRASAPNLRGGDLQKVFLSGANLTAADLRNARLNEAQLEGTILIGAQMQKADLSLAQLQGAVFNFAQLQEANFSNASMQEADFSNARMQRTNLSFA